eukprot:GHVR01013178.1.p2 GENE.GHVR01013178.1~~GHVR01013178.1.p2  ORF type:complete len:128 (+),score=10.00 GHVR01013178.1:2151-2534(+)
MMAIQLEKSERIRINAWVKKLSSVIDNIIWRRNRNLYAKTLFLMLKRRNVSFPFNKNPPENSLPKLSLYDIPYHIREELDKKNCKKNNESDKENISYLGNSGFIEDANYYQIRSKKRYSLLHKTINS